ncbi:MAG: hypothetical protein KDE55_03865 [Novosphingobium sp.]|nr:hypothetical protein [Novosphingobium sp.]
MHKYLLGAALVAAGFALPVAAESAKSHAVTKAVYSAAATSIGTLMEDPVARAILARHLPAVVSNPQFEMARGMTLDDIAPMSGGVITESAMKAIDKELKAAAPAAN